jgi:hypothetical protein
MKDMKCRNDAGFFNNHWQKLLKMVENLSNLSIKLANLLKYNAERLEELHCLLILKRDF